MNIIVENIINIFTLIDGEIHLLTNNNKLIKIQCNDDFDRINNNYINSYLRIKNLNLKQYYTFSERIENKLFISVLFIDIVNVNDIVLNNDLKLIRVSNLDCEDPIIKKSLEFLKKQLIINSTIKKLYPDEFSLPEIQRIYENILDKRYDRRNFRKRLIKFDIIEPLDKISLNGNGRPAKLYKFKEMTEEKSLI